MDRLNRIGREAILITILCLLATILADPVFAQGDTWATKNSMLTPHISGVGGVIDGRLYVSGGHDGGTVQGLEVYDPLADSWTAKTPAPTPVMTAAGGVVNGKLYVAGGILSGTTSVTNVLQEYDSLTDTWATKAPMPTTRTGTAAAAIAGKLYVVGGTPCVCDVELNTLEVYDPLTNTWATKAPMPTPRGVPGAAAIDGKLYVVGGFIQGGHSINTLEVYDPATDTWTTKASMPTARNGLAVGVINGQLHAVGGFLETVTGFALNTHEVYDPATDTWATKAPMPTPRFSLVAGVINSLLYAAGGASSCGGSCPAVKTLEVYTPVLACVPPPSGLVGWWPGDGNAEDIADGNDGTLVGGATFAPGMVGQAFSLDGVDDYVNVGNAPSLQVSHGDFTVDAWVNLASVCGGSVSFCDASIVDKMSSLIGISANNDGWRLLKQVSGGFWFCFGGGATNGCGFGNPNTVISSTVAQPGVWYHVAGVKSGNSISIYVNGVLEATSTLGSFVDTDSTDLVIGSSLQQGARFPGLIDEVELFNRALSDTEIQAIFNAGSAGKCKTVVTVAATDATAAEAGPDPGVFTLTRSGDTTSAVTVNFTAGDTATPGTDYVALGNSVTIPAGQTTATVTVTPILDALIEGNETVTLTIAPGAGYTVGSPSTATVTITDYTGGLLRNPPLVNFGSVRVGSSADRPVVIANGSTTETLVVQINDPTPNPPFSLVSGGGTVVIGPGLAHQATLRFMPTSPGGTTGTLIINSTDPARPTAGIQLNGMGR